MLYISDLKSFSLVIFEVVMQNVQGDNILISDTFHQHFKNHYLAIFLAVFVLAFVYGINIGFFYGCFAFIY